MAAPLARPRATRSSRLPPLVLALALALPAAARADLYLIVSSTSTVKSLQPREAVDLYMGRARALPGGEFATPLDLPRDSAGRAAFYQALTGQGLAQINSYWSRLLFSGQVSPPRVVAGDAEMIESVKASPRAVGYLRQEPQDPGVRTVLVVKEAR